jgi:hypothetical protein
MKREGEGTRGIGAQFHEETKYAPGAWAATPSTGRRCRRRIRIMPPPSPRLPCRRPSPGRPQTCGRSSADAGRLGTSPRRKASLSALLWST